MDRRRDNSHYVQELAAVQSSLVRRRDEGLPELARLAGNDVITCWIIRPGLQGQHSANTPWTIRSDLVTKCPARSALLRRGSVAVSVAVHQPPPDSTLAA